MTDDYRPNDPLSHIRRETSALEDRQGITRSRTTPLALDVNVLQLSWTINEHAQADR